MQYSASLDSFALLVTIGCCLLFLGLTIWCIKSMRSGKADRIMKLIYSGIIVLGVFTVGYSYLYHPQKYVLGNFDLYIKRPVGDVIIHVKDIDEIRKVDNAEMEGTTRTFGVGGLFGYFGKFHNPKIGSMTMYATQRKNYTIIYAKGDAIMISPDDTSFAERIKMKMHDL